MLGIENLGLMDFVFVGRIFGKVLGYKAQPGFVSPGGLGLIFLFYPLNPFYGYF